MLHFNKYVQDAEEFIREIARATETSWDMIKAERILRAVLHALRNRLTPASSLQLIAQLPMLIKALYVDGWHLGTDGKTVRRVGDFIESVREEGGAGLTQELTTDYEVRQAIHAVFNVLKKHVSAGEIKDLLATLPAELKPLLQKA